jgi:hypothetical protein
LNYSEFRQALIAEGIPEATVDLFLAHHALTLPVWREFEKEAAKRVNSGETRIGGKAIAEEVRKNLAASGSKYALNNNWISCYTRAFVIKYPGTRSLFELRHISGVQSGSDEQPEALRGEQQRLFKEAA